jgi:hypothetical protein
MTEVEKSSDPSGYLVRFYDLRYAYPEMPRGVLRSTVFLDKDLHEIGERFGSRVQKIK